MALREFKLPDPGEGLLEAEIVEWKVAVGDTVTVNDIVVEVETAKSLVELPIPYAGTVAGLHVAVGDEVEVGTVIITIEDGLGVADAPAEAPARVAAAAADASPVAEPDEEPVKTLVGYGPKAAGTTRRPRKVAPTGAEPPAPVAPPAPAAPVAPVSLTAERARTLAKPPVRKLAKDLGVDLAAVAPTGEGGVVTRADVQAYAAAPAASSAPVVGASLISPPLNGEREVRTPIKGVRKVTAAAMVSSAFTAPHVTEWVQVDVSETMALVARLKGDREFKDVKVTPLTILAKAVCLAVRRNPGINASWDEDRQEIVEKHYVNLGIAAATPRGLIVPNVKDADRMTLHALAAALGDLTATAREGRTSPADQAGGTLTITNVGVFGVDGGTPILNRGEGAILAFGQVRRLPWVVIGPDGAETIAPRSVTTLSLSFDHRFVDGELGSRFLADVAAIMADPARALVWG